MRLIRIEESRKRGCLYCADAVEVFVYRDTRRLCEHDECPYKVLDKYDTYEAFMKSKDSGARTTRQAGRKRGKEQAKPKVILCRKLSRKMYYSNR